MPKKIDYTGQTINGFYIIGIGQPTKAGRIKWLCRCKCGGVTSINMREIRVNKYCSLCVPKGRPSHGLSHLPEHTIWRSMIQRCRNENDPRYKNYGGRGIAVCSRWKKFENFYEDMGNRPHPKLTIERRNNNKGYSPQNCYWGTRKEQARNFRSNVILEYNGEKKCISEWAEIIGVTHDTISRRLKSGLTTAEALTKEHRPNKKYIDVDGVKMTISQAERHLGFGGGTLSYRLRHGMSEYDAIHTPIKTKA